MSVSPKGVVLLIFSDGVPSTDRLTLIISLLDTSPEIFPQNTVCTEKMHTPPSVGTPVQVTVVRLVVMGQVPQFEARIM